MKPKDYLISNDLILASIRPLFAEYEQWNEGRSDGAIVHTDALDDFIEWLEAKTKIT